MSFWWNVSVCPSVDTASITAFAPEVWSVIVESTENAEMGVPLNINFLKARPVETVKSVLPSVVMFLINPT